MAMRTTFSLSHYKTQPVNWESLPGLPGPPAKELDFFYGCAYYNINPCGGETVSTGIVELEIACRGSRRLVKQAGLNTKADSYEYALAA